MRLGYVLGTWASRDLSAFERLATRGRALNWIDGLPIDSPVTIWRPTEIGQVFRILKALGSDFETNEFEKINPVCAPVEKDYEYHLQTLGILLDGEVSGGISGACLAALKSNAQAFPNDALIQAAVGVYTGSFDPAIALLLDDAYTCPSYVRPVPAYCTVHKAYAAHVVTSRYGVK